MISSTGASKNFIDTFNPFESVLYQTVLEILGIKVVMVGITEGDQPSIRYFVPDDEVNTIQALYEAYLPIAKFYKRYQESTQFQIHQMEKKFKQLSSLRQDIAFRNSILTYPFIGNNSDIQKVEGTLQINSNNRAA